MDRQTSSVPHPLIAPAACRRGYKGVARRTTIVRLRALLEHCDGAGLVTPAGHLSLIAHAHERARERPGRLLTLDVRYLGPLSLGAGLVVEVDRHPHPSSGALWVVEYRLFATGTPAAEATGVFAPSASSGSFEVPPLLRDEGALVWSHDVAPAASDVACDGSPLPAAVAQWMDEARQLALAESGWDGGGLGDAPPAPVTLQQHLVFHAPRHPVEALRLTTVRAQIRRRSVTWLQELLDPGGARVAGAVTRAGVSDEHGNVRGTADVELGLEHPWLFRMARETS